MTTRTAFKVVSPHSFGPVWEDIKTLAIPADADGERVLDLAMCCLTSAKGMVDLLQQREGAPIDGHETFAIRLMLGTAIACYAALGVEP